jgi:hypothetical protein
VLLSDLGNPRAGGREVKYFGWRIEGAIQQAMRRTIALLPTNLVGMSAVNDEDLKGIYLVTHHGENSADWPMDDSR